LQWIEAYTALSGLSFSEVVRVAVAQLIESKVITMGDVQKLLDLAEFQSRQVEELALNHHAIRIAGGLVSPEREVTVKHERLQLYDQTLALMRTLLALAESKEAAQKPEMKIDAILASNALTRTAESIMNDYEHSVTEAQLKQMRNYLDRLKQASGEGSQGSGTGA
jgi:hypothetical protein